MARTKLPRLPGETELEFRRRYGREKIRRLRAKWAESPDAVRQSGEPLGIEPKRSDETGEEYQKRHTREKMRIYRAAKPKGPRRVRGKGKGLHAGSLMTPEEWEAERQRPGETEDDWKKRKNRLKVARSRKRHPEAGAERARKYYAENRDSELERQRAYRAANPEKLKAYSARYYAANKDKRKATLKAWNLANPERVKARALAWREANRALCAYYSSAWRKACREQTPIWADPEAIMAVYVEATRISAETGVPQHVDHFYPLRGKTVSGLHVHTNLRIIPAVENMRKHNKLIEA